MEINLFEMQTDGTRVIVNHAKKVYAHTLMDDSISKVCLFAHFSFTVSFSLVFFSSAAVDSCLLIHMIVRNLHVLLGD
jgi:hypothetical protein